MKKRILIIITFVLLSLLPLGVYAEEFKINETDISIEFDTNEWNVFTRDNIENNPNLDKLGIDYNTFNKTMNDNYIYLDAVFLNNDATNTLEFIIRKTKADSIINFSNYTDDDILDIAKGLADKQNSNNYDVYKNNYKYAYLNYTDKGYYLVEYYTVVNGDSYTVTVQKTNSINSDEKEKIKNIIDTIEFDVDETMEEENSETGIKFSTISKYVRSAIIGAVIAIVVCLIYFIFKKKNR